MYFKIFNYFAFLEKNHVEIEARKIAHLIAWRRMKGRVGPSDALTVRDCIDMEGPEWKRVIYKRLRAAVGGLHRTGQEQARARGDTFFPRAHIVSII